MAKIDLKGLSLKELHSLHKRISGAIDRHDAKQRSAALSAVKAKAKAMGFSLEELTEAKTAKGKSAPKKRRAPAKVLYRHPEDPALTWVGRGARPKWLKEAIAQGRSADEFKVQD